MIHVSRVGELLTLGRPKKKISFFFYETVAFIQLILEVGPTYEFSLCRLKETTGSIQRRILFLNLTIHSRHGPPFWTVVIEKQYATSIMVVS